MKIKFFTIPNILTLGNLLCGVAALLSVVVDGDFLTASILLIVAAVFDFCDGLAARVLNQCSPIGKELDSLADLISFGLAPSIIMMWLFLQSDRCCEAELWGSVGCYIPLMIVAFSALRLAKFNIDDSQSCCFEGLPTPACALACLSMALFYHYGYKVTGEVIATISVVLSYLLISPIRMFSFKLKGFAWASNKDQYIFVAASLITLVVCLVLDRVVFALPVVMALYIVISTISHFVCNKRA